MILSRPGYGGSCFPKDTKALAKIGRDNDSVLTLIESTVKANEFQKIYMAEKIDNSLGGVKGKELAILGLSFKPRTDDMREAPSITILHELAKRGARFKVYDPIAMDEAKKVFEEINEKIKYCSSEYETVKNCDALVIITEWNQFRNLDLDRVKKDLKQSYFFDLRNIYEREMLEQRGFKYIAVGQ